MDREPRFPGVEWYCDHCGAHLNSQAGFDDHKYIWKCKICGGKNSISEDNIYDSNLEIYSALFEIIKLVRTICLHGTVFMAVLSAFNLLPDSIARIHPTVAATYPVLVVVTLLLMLLSQYHDFGIIASVLGIIKRDLFRPYTEVVSANRILFGFRVNKHNHNMVLRLLRLLLYVIIVVLELIIIHYVIKQKWGSFGEFVVRLKQWFVSLNDLKSLYIPYAISYLFMNIITFFAFGIDKYYAVYQKWRIKESTLFVMAILFGGIGGAIGMKAFRHKINKPGFKIIIPVLGVGQMLLFLWFTFNYIR